MAAGLATVAATPIVGIATATKGLKKITDRTGTSIVNNGKGGSEFIGSSKAQIAKANRMKDALVKKTAKNMRKTGKYGLIAAGIGGSLYAANKLMNKNKEK